MRNRSSTVTTPRYFLTAPAVLLVAAMVGIFAPGWSGWEQARANATDIATLPVFSSTPPTNEVKPNVMLVLDDSGSMDWTYMPDEAGSYAGRYGYPSHQCNGVYYNPAIKYVPPVDASGNSFTNQSFTSAANDGFGITTGSTNLSSSFKAYGSDTAQAAYYYTYAGTQTTEKLKDYYTTSSTFYKECNSSIGSAPGNAVFTKILVSATSGPGSTDERTNFANWYSYYRTRMNMMKTSTGLAFKQLDNHFRVGFFTINNNVSPAFLNISDFDATHKANFYAKLYSSDTGNSTPLRAALSKAGRLYAGKLSTLNGGTVVDPVQYACQQNYTILSTDGQWNEADNLVVQIDGSTQMGNQDGALPRPYNDGSQVTTTIVTPYTSTQDRTTTTNVTTQTKTWTRDVTTVGAACSTVTAPSNTASAPMNVGNSRTGALGYSTVDPDGSNSRCYNVGNNVWFCRSPSSGSPAVSAASATGSNGTAWYLVSNIASQSGCISASSAFGNNYSSTAGICPTQGTTGKYVTIRPQTQTESITGYSATVTDRYTATQTTTQSIISGVPGAVGPLTPAAPSYSLTTPGTPVISTTTDTCGGQPAPCPSAAGTWTNGSPTVNNVCVATASLPAAGTSTATLSNTVNMGQTQSTTTVQLTTQVAGTPTSTSIGTGGVANTLADVAAYYYGTNLRTSALNNCTGPTIAPSTTPNDLCLPNKVPASGVDTATWQHMTTFTLGLGVRGRMVFSPTYLTDSAGDYYDVLKGNIATGTNCTWRDTLTVAGGKCNWPVPGSNTPENSDDLWHAGVNGRGSYFSATDPATLTAGLANALDTIVNTPKPGTASAAATTNPKITSKNNFQFSSYFKTVEWSGELIRQTMNLADGSVPYYDPFNPKPATYDWSAQGLLNAQAYTTRNIYTSNGSALIPFVWGNLDATQKSYFTTPYITTSPPSYSTPLTGLSQFCSAGLFCISSTAQSNTTVATGGAAGEALVNFLRGDRTNEEGATTDNNKFYRYRVAVLGDIVSAQPQYVGEPTRYYSDSGYGAFKTLWAGRTAVVYTAANDGMLHAFKADHTYNSSGALVTQDGGKELWAYIPSFVLPRLYTLADKSYQDKHQYSVEGTPVSGDICPKAPSANCADTEWKTILVGGVNAGGTGYYAMDITNPTSPKLLWEFTDPNMGLSFGKPQIAKLDDGTWVVLLTSGYNNCPRTGAAAQANCVKNGTGDGQGRLYVLNANTGAQITGSPISTGVGTVADPSGLAQIIAQVDSNNVTTRVYGGDLYGNVWRFNVTTAGFGKRLLATLKDSAGNIQPVTVKPQVTTINGNPFVYLGTGRYLGVTDVGISPKNSFYAIKDDIFSASPTSFNNPRTYSSFIGQQAVDGSCPLGTDVSICLPGQQIRTVTQSAGNAGDSLKNKDGWYIDFPSTAGEIQFTDPKLQLGTLAFSTSVPVASTSQVCSPTTSGSDGTAFGYMLDYLTGGAVGTNSGVIANNLGSGVATAPQIAQLPNGTVIAKYRLSTGQEVSVNLRFSASGGQSKRISWRELISE